MPLDTFYLQSLEFIVTRCCGDGKQVKKRDWAYFRTQQFSSSLGNLPAAANWKLVGFISLKSRGMAVLVWILGQLIHYPVSNSVQEQMVWEQ